MSYILIPHQNYAGGINFSLENPVSGYELKKAYSSDTKEYAIIPAASNTYFNFASISAGVQALLLWSGNYSGTPTLQSSSTEDFTTTTPMNPSNTYGSTKKLITYSNQGSLYYRIPPIGIDVDLRQISYGRLYELPDNMRLETRSHSYKYDLSEVYFNLLGEKRYSGFENQGLRKSHTIEFEYLPPADKDTLIDLFKLGKTCLPVWFIDDTADPSSWMLVRMRELNYSEPYAGYYNVSISMEEF